MAGNKDYTKAESIYDFTAKGTILEPFASFQILKRKIIQKHKNDLANII